MIQVPVLEWNLAIGFQSERHARRQMRAIAAISPTPHVLVLAEARRALYDVYVSELQSRTGKSWRGVSQAHCAQNGWNSGTGSCEKLEDECVMILSSLEVTASDTILLPHGDRWHSARAAVHAAIEVGGTALHVFGTHLQSGAGSAAERARLESIAMLKTWIDGFGAPAIVGGDFNALPTSPAIASVTVGMASALVDTWEVCGAGASATHPAWWPTRKIDYWFADSSGRAKATSTSVPRCVPLSDHCPLQALFEL